MATYQTTYTAAPAKGLPGLIANEEKCNKISRTVESSAGILFGQPAFRGSGDHGVIVGTTQAFTATGANGSTAPAGATIGTLSAAAGARIGVYTATCEVGGSATASKWRVEDPLGNYVGTATGNTAFTSTDNVTFTITDSGTDPVPGEAFTITVAATADGDFVGLAVLNPAVPPVAAGATLVDGYPQYFTGAFMTEGSMYVTAGASVNDGDDVYWNPATSRFTNTTTHVRIPGCKFDTTGTNGGIVEVSLKNR